MRKSLQDQLCVAWEAARRAGMTYAELAKKADLSLDRSSLSRKLSADADKRQKMSTEECEAIARALRVQVTYGREARAS